MLTCMPDTREPRLHMVYWHWVLGLGRSEVGYFSAMQGACDEADDGRGYM